MKATLFAVPASHPSLAAELMLRHKGVDYQRVDLVTALHRGLVRALGFPGVTVPALRIEGARISRSPPGPLPRSSRLRRISTAPPTRTSGATSRRSPD